jgi:uncharacterized membrane protein (DUF2068 family)
MREAERNRLLFRTIAAFKLLKAALLAAAGVGILKLIHRDIGTVAEHLVSTLHLNPGNRYVVRAVARASNVTPQRLRELGVGTFVYAALFLTEGIGLWSLKTWGEWVTVIITGSMLPVEAYELWHRPTLPKGSLLLLNAAIVAYLVHRIWRKLDRST